MIGNALVGHGLNKGEAATQGAAYLEEAAIAQEEEHIMSEEVTSEDEDKVERQMLTVALVNSVVESSKQSPDAPDERPPDDDSKKRYSLRKRRRPSGDQTSEAAGGNTSRAKVERTSRGQQSSSKTSKPPETVSQAQSTKARQPKTSKPASPAVRTKMQIKTEAVPACTVAVAAAPLPVPLAVTSLPRRNSLPPALQPPLRSSLPPRPASKAAANAAHRPARPNLAKVKAKQLVPAARVQVSSKPLTPNPGAVGVPNPLSNPLPASKTIPVNTALSPQAASNHTFKAGTKLTVPCPLPPSTFQNGVERKGQEQSSAPPELAPEKKKVTIDLPPQQRGRIFSVDLDRKFLSPCSFGGRSVHAYLTVLYVT